MFDDPSRAGNVASPVSVIAITKVKATIFVSSFTGLNVFTNLVS